MIVGTAKNEMNNAVNVSVLYDLVPSSHFSSSLSYFVYTYIYIYILILYVLHVYVTY